MSVLIATSSGLIKWSLLGKILVLSATISIGLVVLFTLAVNSLSMFRRASSSTLVRVVNAGIGVITSAVILATLVWGLYFIVHK